MPAFVDTYIRAMLLLAEMRKGKKGANEQQVAFFHALPDEAKKRLDEGEYPPYHFVNTARRSVGASKDTARNWLQAFLYWRRKSQPPSPLPPTA